MSHRSLALRLPLLVALVAPAACAVPTSGGGEVVATTRAPIQGGMEDANDTAVIDLIWTMSGGYYSECSGSLIAPNVVLTAHHCVSAVQNGDMGVSCGFTSFAPPTSVGAIDVTTDEYLASTPNGAYHGVHQIVVPPNSTNTSFCGVDQAILILADNVPAVEAVPLVPRVDSDIAAKDTYSAVGFGTTDEVNGAGTRRRLDGLTVKCVGKGCASVAPGQVDSKHEFLGDHGTCEGDSGGPALDTEGRVVGVTSRGGPDCTFSVYGDVYSWADWIKQTTVMAAQYGGYPPPPWATGWPTDPAYSDPIGSSCEPADCPSNICLVDDDGSYCSRLCEDAAPCPTGYSCENIQGQNICQRPPPPPPTSSSSASSSSGMSTGATHAKSGCAIRPTDGDAAPGLAALALGLLAVCARSRRARRAVSTRRGNP